MSVDAFAEWLALREAADAAARSVSLMQTLVEVLPPDRPIHVLDLGTGTGANFRYLASRLPGAQHWLLVDRDPALLSEIAARITSWGAARGCDVNAAAGGLVVRGERGACRIETRRLDLGRLTDPTIFSGRHLVTASALLDLVSEEWLRELSGRCRTSGAAVLFPLNYNGRSRCAPAEPEDEAIRDLMNRHQRSNDKGFGRAAGPDAVECAERCFAAAGYQVRRDASDWILAPEQGELQRQLIEGWAQAAEEIAPEQAPMIRDWLARRLGHVAAGRSRVVVGHDDLAAWPRVPIVGNGLPPSRDASADRHGHGGGG